MKKVNLIWIFALILVISAISVNAWINCTPSSCDASYTDNGVACTGGDCTRNCTINVCGSSWSQVHSTTFGWGTEIEDEQEDSSSSYTPTSTQYCYNFTYEGPPASTTYIRMDIDPHPTYDCRPVMMGGFKESNNWFSSFGCYVGTQTNSQVSNLCKLVDADMPGEDDADDNYRNDASEKGSMYCAPNTIACDPFSPCDIGCYNKSTYGHTVQGYYKDKGTAAATIYDGAGCGNSYVDNNKMTPIAFTVYQADVTAQNNDKTCERTNEAPTASNVKVIPENPTAGDDLLCNFTYYDIEGFEEKDSTYEWWKNSVNQNINSQILGKGNLTVNDQWYCKVTPSDGLSNGTKQQSSNTATILSTIQNPKMYVEDSLAWSSDGYYSNTEIITSFVGELNNALGSCTADEVGYCNISITFSSDSSGKLNLSDLEIYYDEQEEGVSNLTISSLQNITINNTHMLFEFIINNTGSTTLNNINWTLDAGDGSSIIKSEDTFSLTAGASAFVYVEYNYTTLSTFTVNATANSGTLTASRNLSINLGNATNNLDVYDFSMYNVSSTHKVFSFMIKNIAENQNLTDISWSLNSGLETVDSIYTYNLTPNNFSFVFVEYNYTQTGDFTPIASASSGSNQDSETLPTIDIPDIEASNLTLLYNSSTHRIFFFTITNMLSTPLTNVNWTFDTKNNNVISANQLFSLNSSENAFIFVEYNYSSAGTYNVNATAINGSLKDSTYYEFTIS